MLAIYEQMELLNKTAFLSTEGLRVPVIIKNFKQAYGKTNVLITPVNGTGEKWVSFDRVKTDK